MVGHKTPTLYFINNDEQALYAADVETGQTRKLAALPARGRIRRSTPTRRSPPARTSRARPERTTASAA
jgi:hypothetical protein